METNQLFSFVGDERLRQPVLDAFASVLDAKTACTPLVLGLVRDVHATPGSVVVRMDVGARPCFDAQLLLSDLEHALERMLPAQTWIEVKPA